MSRVHEIAAAIDSALDGGCDGLLLLSMLNVLADRAALIRSRLATADRAPRQRVLTVPQAARWLPCTRTHGAHPLQDRQDPLRPRRRA